MPAPSPVSPPSSSAPSGAGTAVKSVLPFDILRVALHLAKGWKSLLLLALLGGASAAGLGWKTFRTKYTVQVQLVRRESQNTFQASEMGESFRPRQFNTATVMSMMRSASLMEKTGRALTPPVNPLDLQARIEIRPEKNTDLITVAYTSDDSPERAAEALNLYANNVVQLTEELQAQEAQELLTFITDQAARTESALNHMRQEMLDFSKESGLFNAEKETESYLRQLGDLDLKIETARINRETVAFRIVQTEKELARQDPNMQRLQEARGRLAELMTQYTAQHPLVIEQQARVRAQQESAGKPGAPDSFQSTGNTVANSLYLDLIRLRSEQDTAMTEEQKLQTFRDLLKTKLDTIPDKNMQSSRLKGQVTSLETTRDLLAGRQREARLFSERALGYYRLFAPARSENTEVSGRAKKLILAGLAGALLAAGLTIGLRALRAALDDRIVSPSDLRRATGAPVVAMMPPREGMDDLAMERWRFSAWAKLIRAVPAPYDGALILGLMSAAPGEGKTTWLRQFARAGLERGVKVLVVSPYEEGADEKTVYPLEAALEDPRRLLETLRSARPPAMELRPGADFAWTPETRSRWRAALDIWRREPALAVLVELPPAIRLDSLLLAETLPALLWVSDSGRTRRGEISAVLQTIRQSGIPLSAALLNRVPPVFMKLPDLAKFGLCLAFALCTGPSNLMAQEPAPLPLPLPLPLGTEGPPPASAGDLPPVVPHDQSLSDAPAAEVPVLAPIPVPLPPVADPGPPPPPANPRLAEWQRELTLGPGDVVNLQVYGYKQYTRTEVPVGPDGTLNYLQVTGFKASGLTIDQLRAGLTDALRVFIQNAQVIVTPSAWRSKKYFLMGTVTDRGAFTLDRPMTLMEATARARGIATGLVEQNTVEIADMKRAFLVRGGKRLPVDFAKLFYDGDLSQNIMLEPGDYIYFPSNILNEVYILGAVASPGRTGVTQNLTALGAITIRGGFRPGAYRKKVLIIRGGPDKREIIEVDAAAVLAGQKVDVPLEPKDLVYVTEKPWKRAEEILDLAVKAFIQSATTSWTGENIRPLIGDPILPSFNDP